jgi:hypothetical protein
VASWWWFLVFGGMAHGFASMKSGDPNDMEKYDGSIAYYGYHFART